MHGLEAKVKHGGGSWGDGRVKGQPPRGALNQRVFDGNTKDTLRAVFSQESSFMQAWGSLFELSKPSPNARDCITA